MRVRFGNARRAPDRPRIALRWRYVILGCVAGCIVLGLIVTLLMTPRYTADSTIEISREADQVTNFQGVQREANAADQEFYQTQYGLLKSRSLAERVVNTPSPTSMCSAAGSSRTAQPVPGGAPMVLRGKRRSSARLPLGAR